MLAINFDIDYVDVENLRNLAKENIAFREKEVVIVKSMNAKTLESFHTIYRQRQIERAMQQVPQEIKAVKSHAMNSVFKKELETLAKIDPEAARKLEEKMALERAGVRLPNLFNLALLANNLLLNE